MTMTPSEMVLEEEAAETARKRALACGQCGVPAGVPHAAHCWVTEANAADVSRGIPLKACAFCGGDSERRVNVYDFAKIDSGDPNNEDPLCRREECCAKARAKGRLLRAKPQPSTLAVMDAVGRKMYPTSQPARGATGGHLDLGGKYSLSGDLSGPSAVGTHNHCELCEAVFPQATFAYSAGARCCPSCFAESTRRIEAYAEQVRASRPDPRIREAMDAADRWLCGLPEPLTPWNGETYGPTPTPEAERDSMLNILQASVRRSQERETKLGDECGRLSSMLAEVRAELDGVLAENARLRRAAERKR